MAGQLIALLYPEPLRSGRFERVPRLGVDLNGAASEGLLGSQRPDPPALTSHSSVAS